MSNSNVYAKYEHKDGRKLVVMYDEFAENPILDDCFCDEFQWFFAHKRYNLAPKGGNYSSADDAFTEISYLLPSFYDGHKWIDDSRQYGWDQADAERMIAYVKRFAIIVPVYLYDHSGLTISTGPFYDIFDSGLLGFVAIPKAKARKLWKGTPGRCYQMAEDSINAMLETLDHYLTGMCFWFQIYDANGNEANSCGGFYGPDIRKNGLLDHAGMDMADLTAVD